MGESKTTAQPTKGICSYYLAFQFAIKQTVGIFVTKIWLDNSIFQHQPVESGSELKQCSAVIPVVALQAPYILCTPPFVGGDNTKIDGTSSKAPAAQHTMTWHFKKFCAV